MLAWSYPRCPVRRGHLEGPGRLHHHAGDSRPEAKRRAARARISGETTEHISVGKVARRVPRVREGVRRGNLDLRADCPHQHPSDFDRIARRYPRRRGKRRGKNRDALARSPTGSGWFVEGGKAGRRSPDDPLVYDPNGVDHAHRRWGDAEDHLTEDERAQDGRSADELHNGADDRLEGEGGTGGGRSPDDPMVYDPNGEDHAHGRWGDAEDHLTEDEPAQDERSADELRNGADDRVEGPQNRDHVHEHSEDDPTDEQDHTQRSNVGDLIQSSGKLDDDEDETCGDWDEDDYAQWMDWEMDEYVQRIREYAKSGSFAASETRSGYPILDAMREIGVVLTRENYLGIYLRLHGTATEPSLVEDESMLPPMFRRPK